MTDEESFWRPPPPSPYVPTGKVLTVSASTLTQTAALLQAVGRRESACIWLGELDEKGSGLVKAVVVPAQINRPGNYLVPSESMLRVSQFARSEGWTVVGAIHSHPGRGVEHSRYDDEMTPSRRAVSIVFPEYGAWSETWPRGLGVHEYFEKYWHLLSSEQARARVQLVAGTAAPVKDMR